LLEALNEALAALAALCVPQSVTGLREEAVRHRERSPFFALFPVTRLSGRTGAVVDPPPANDDEGREAAIRSAMFDAAATEQRFRGEGMIVPALRQIRSEHAARLDDFMEIAEASWFVPRCREGIFARGLYAGYNLELVESTHLLIPQVENSVRAILEHRGVITSGFDRADRQNEFDLNRTLAMPELVQVFGEDLVFNLRGLLVERSGSNLRNEMAHGLIDEAGFMTGVAIYLWGAVLRLCVLSCRVATDDPDMVDR
jgi:hypothetical protein